MQVIDRFRARINQGIPYLAWASFVLALTGGVILPGTPFGETLSDVIRSVTWEWVPPVAFSAGIVGVILDLRHDLIPDRMAVYVAALAPTWAGAITGKLAEKVSEFGEWVSTWTLGPLTEWSGIMNPAQLSILCMVLAYVIAKRVMKDRKSGARGHAHGGVV